MPTAPTPEITVRAIAYSIAAALSTLIVSIAMCNVRSNEAKEATRKACVESGNSPVECGQLEACANGFHTCPTLSEKH